MAGQFLDDFKSRMTSFARPNLFEVEIYNPTKKMVIEEIRRRLTFNCFSAQIPGMTTMTTEKDEGYRSIAYQKAYEDVSLGFYVNGDMKELKVFQNWMKLMIDPKTNHVGFYDDYKATVSIKNLNQQQDTALTTTLHDAYPKTLSPIGLDYGSTDDILKIDVTFTYRHYTQTFGKLQEPVGRGNFTETSAEDIPNPLSAINTLKDKTGNLVTKNAQGLFVPAEHRTNQ